jgi:hypothetical protein
MPTSNSVEVNLKFAADVAALQAAITQLQAVKAAATDVGGGAQAAGAAFQELQAKLGWLSSASAQFNSVGQAAQALASRGGSLSQAYSQVGATMGQVTNLLQVQGAAMLRAAQAAGMDSAAIATLNANLGRLQVASATATDKLGPQSQAVLGKLTQQYNEFGKVGNAAQQTGTKVSNLGFMYGNLAARLGSIGPQLAASATGFKGMGMAINDVTVLTRIMVGQLQVAAGTALVIAGSIGALIAVVGGLTVAYTGLVVQGVKLNAELQNTQTALAATLGNLASGTYGGQAGALKASADAMADLQQRSQAAQVPLKQVLTTFNDLSAAATLSGASLDKQAQLFTQLVASQSRMHVTDSQLISDTKSLLNGRVSDNNQIALSLLLSKEQVLAARENGTITDLLISKTRESAQAYKQSSDNFDDSNKKLQAALQQLELAAGKPFMQPLIQAIQNVTTAISSSQMQSAIQNFGQWITDEVDKDVRSFQALVNIINSVKAAMGGLVKAADDFRFNVATQLSALANNPIFKALPGSGAVTDAANTTLTSESNKQAEGLDQQEQLVRQSAASVAADLKQAAESAKTIPASLTAKPPTQAPPGGYPKEGGGKKGAGDKEDAQEMAELTKEMTLAQAQYNDAIEKAKVEREAGVISLQQETQMEQQADTKYISSLESIKQKLEDERAKLQQIGNEQGGLSTKQQTQMDSLDTKIEKVNISLLKMQAALQNTTFSGSFIAQLNKFLDQGAFTGAKAAQDFESLWTKAFSSVGNGLAQMITGGKNFGQTMSQVGKSMLTDLINIGVKMLENYILQEAMQIFGISAQTTTAATSLATGKAIEAAYAPAAIAASIASYGAAATVGTAAYEAAIAVGTAGGGLAEGGIVAGHPSHKDNVLMPMARGEGVVKTSSVQHYGTGMIHAMNALTFPKHGFAEGGIVGGGAMEGAGKAGGGSSSGRPVHVNVMNSHEELTQHVLNHPDAEHKIVSTVKKNRYSLRV